MDSMIYSLVSFGALNFMVVGGLLILKTTWNKVKYKVSTNN